MAEDRKYTHIARVEELTGRCGSGYPSPFDAPCRQRVKTRLGDAVGLSQFGVNMVLLPPGTWSSQRHWHVNEDEFVYVIEGEVTLVTNEGETLLRAGDFAGFPANSGNGHHLVNRSDRDVRVLEVGTRAKSETAFYSDIDMMVEMAEAGTVFRHKSGEPYP